jgi:hypothetical protein
VELPGASRVVSSPLPKQFHRVWSTPNLHGACQVGGVGMGPSSPIQCGHIYLSHVQLGHSSKCLEGLTPAGVEMCALILYKKSSELQLEFSVIRI